MMRVYLSRMSSSFCTNSTGTFDRSWSVTSALPSADTRSRMHTRNVLNVDGTNANRRYMRSRSVKRSCWNMVMAPEPSICGALHKTRVCEMSHVGATTKSKTGTHRDERLGVVFNQQLLHDSPQLLGRGAVQVLPHPQLFFLDAPVGFAEVVRARGAGEELQRLFLVKLPRGPQERGLNESRERGEESERRTVCVCVCVCVGGGGLLVHTTAAPDAPQTRFRTPSTCHCRGGRAWPGSHA